MNYLLINNQTKEELIIQNEILHIGINDKSGLKISSRIPLRASIKVINNEVFIIKEQGNITVNDKPVLKKLLEDGDEISFGSEKYIFHELNDYEEEVSSYEAPALSEYLFIDGITQNNENEQFIQSLLSLNNFAHQVTSILDFGTLLNVIVQMATRIIKTEKGFLLLREKNSELSVKTAINMNKEIEDPELFQKIISEKVLGQMGNLSTIKINSLSINELNNVNSIIVSGLKARNSVLGYICLMNKQTGDEFDDKDLFLIESLSNQAAIAIENSILYEKVKTESDLRNYLQRYLPRNMVTKILENKIDISMDGKLNDCTVLFADICGFTSLSEKLKPKEIVSFLNQYLTIMTKIIFSYEGSVDKFMGDGIMAVFGVPLTNPDHALGAVTAALEMKKQAAILRAKFYKELGIIDFNIRIGINSGDSVFGNIGSPQRMDFTVIGDNVNVAQRMEANAPRGGILISNNTFERVKNFIKARECGPIKVKGKEEQIKVYEVIDKLKPLELTENNENKMRMHIRVPLKTFVTISKGDIRSNGLIRDISIGGVSIGAVGNFRANEKIDMTFKLSNNSTFRNIKGLIRHVEKSKFEGANSKGNIIMGVEFVNLSDDITKELMSFISQERAKIH